ncbi:MAG: hypothetical protein ACREIF_17240 [Chthoniobacterales bacterium]
MLGKNLLPIVFILVLSCALAQGSWLDRWVVRGIIVNKTFRPTSLSGSLGADGIYKLEVRDERNAIHHQMVPRSVFFAYQIGDQFDAGVRLRPRDEREKTARIALDEARTRRDSTTSRVSPAPPATGPRNRLVNACFTQDTLPETEGF